MSHRNKMKKIRPARFRSLLKGWNLFFTILTTLLIPLLGYYLIFADADLVFEGLPIVVTKRLNPGENSVRILNEITLRVRNRGLKPGHIDRVDIRPSKFDQPAEVQVRYIDRREIARWKTKELRFQFVQTVRHTGYNSFMVVFIDGNGKQVEEIQTGSQVWPDVQPTPPKTPPPPAD